MSSQSASGSSAAPHANPFQDSQVAEGSYVSDIPLSGGAQPIRATQGSLSGEHPVTVDDITSSGSTSTSTSRTGLTGSTTATGSQQVDNAAANVQARAQQATQDIKQRLGSLADGETKPGLAGDLAPSQSPIPPKSAPEGTEHVTNILSGVAGAILSAPAAALEVASPTAASKLSDGVAAISARMPHVSLQDATNAVAGVANAAYAKVPEGTAQTVQNYVGAAQAKTTEVLPPALGGSTTRGNTGEGQTAKTPAQLADEASANTGAAVNNAAATTGNVLSNAVGTAQAYISQAIGLAQQKGSEAATATQQAATDAANATQRAANDAAATTQQVASDAAATTQRAANTASAKAHETRDSAARSVDDAARRTQERAADVSASAQQQQSSYSSGEPSSTYSQQPHSTYSVQPTTTSSSTPATAGDLLNRTAAANTSEVDGLTHGTTYASGSAPVQVGSNNPYARPHGAEGVPMNIVDDLVDQQRRNLASDSTSTQH